MPHLILEYTDNIRGEAHISELLKKLNGVLIKHGEAFPIGGIRSRAIELHDYCVADGAEDDAFVHATLKIAAGRSEEAKQTACDELFDVITAHFADLYEHRYLALSLELHEFQRPTWRQNNIHQRFK